MKTLFIVVPCYNEKEVLKETTKRLNDKLNNLIKMKKISSQSKVLYVNDGSKDKTWELIKVIHNNNSMFWGLSLSRNRGHQNALLAGLMTAKEYADIIISMDADLQDDINAIDEMIEKYNEGSEIVYGVRNSRKKDTWFKRNTALAYYRFLKFMGVDIVYNHADYRLTSKRVLNELEKYGEVNLFLRGIFPLIGFKHDVVYYERHDRFAVKSKYPLKKMLHFSWDGITSFSIKPIKMVLSIGIIIFVVSLFVMIYSLIVKLLGFTVSGWTFIVCSIWLLAGVQMLSIGLIGEYVGKIYSETKHRPRYIIDETLKENQNKSK